MGIIIEDTITLDNGLTANNTYGSFGESELTLKKNEVITLDESNNETTTYEYIVMCKGIIWSSKQYRDNSRTRLHAVNISITLNPSQLNSNLYTLLYNSWKTQYTTVSDSSD